MYRTTSATLYTGRAQPHYAVSPTGGTVCDCTYDYLGLRTAIPPPYNAATDNGLIYTASYLFNNFYATPLMTVKV